MVDYACGWTRRITPPQEHYSLIILDIMLPGLDGWQVRALRTAHQSPVIVFDGARLG